MRATDILTYTPPPLKCSFCLQHKKSRKVLYVSYLNVHESNRHSNKYHPPSDTAHSASAIRCLGKVPSVAIEFAVAGAERGKLCEVRPACMGTLGDLHKTATKETYKRDLQKRPTKENICVKWDQRVGKDSETYTRELQKRATKETFTNRSRKEMFKRHLHKETLKRDLQKRPPQRDLQERPIKQTSTKRPTSTKENSTKRSTRETYKRDLHKEIYKRDLQKRPLQRDLQERPTKETSTKRPTSTKETSTKRSARETYKRDLHKENYKRDLQKRPPQRDLQERPTKETYKRGIMSGCCDSSHLPKRTCSKRDIQKKTNT